MLCGTACAKSRMAIAIMRGFSQLELPDDDRVAMAAEDRSTVFKAAMEYARAGACLQGRELAPPEAFGPIGRKRGVGRSRHGILVDSEIRHEDPARDVLLAPARGDDRHPVDFPQRRKVRLHG